MNKQQAKIQAEKSKSRLKRQDVKGEIVRNRIQVQFDIEYGGTEGIKIEGPSNTVPDLNLTVRQLLQNHTRGQESEIKVSEPLYFDMEIPKITDLTDVQAYKDQLNSELQKVEQFIEQDHQNANQRRETEKAEKELKEQQEKDLKRGKQLRIDEEAKKA